MSAKNSVEWEEKVWGRVLHIFTSEKAGVSYLEVKKGFQCSQHFHRQRVNSFAMISGKLLILEWDADAGGKAQRTILLPGQIYSIPTLVEHRFCVLESGVVVEYYSPEKDGGVVNISDIVRRDTGGKMPDGEY